MLYWGPILWNYGVGVGANPKCFFIYLFVFTILYSLLKAEQDGEIGDGICSYKQGVT